MQDLGKTADNLGKTAYNVIKGSVMRNLRNFYLSVFRRLPCYGLNVDEIFFP